MSEASHLERSRVRFAQAILPIRQRAQLIGLASALALGLLTAMSLLLLAMWFDLTLPLSAWMRRLVLGGAVATSLLVVIRYFLFARHAANDRALALQLDERSHADGRVMAGFELMEQEAKAGSEADAGGLTLGLASLAADDAESVCQVADPCEVLPSAVATYWWKVVGCAVATLLLVALLAPRLAWTQMTRMLVPLESQLPYSATSIEVFPGETEILFGDDLEVIAEIEGPLPDQLELVIRSEGAAREEALPMLPETETRWRTLLARVTEPADYFVRAENTRSRTHRLSVRMTPEFESVHCQLIPPAYTRRSGYEGPLPEKGIRGISGTRVLLQVASNRPLQLGELIVRVNGKPKQYALNPVSNASGSDDARAAGGGPKIGIGGGRPIESSVVSGEWVMAESGEFEISLIDVDGTRSSDTIEGTIEIIPDEKPVIRLLQPKAVSLATPDIPLPITVLAEDDYGLSKMTLFRGLNGSPEMGTELELPSTGVAKARVETSLPLAAYGLEPGDEITLFARVEDNDPGGVKGAESQVATVRIISRKQMAEIELSRRGLEAILSKQRHAQRQLEKVKDALRDLLDEGKPGTKDGEQDAGATGDSLPGAASSGERDRGDGAQDEGDQSGAGAREAFAERVAQTEALASAASDAIRNSAQSDLPVDMDPQLNEQLKGVADQLSDVAERLREMQEKLESGEGLNEEDRQELKEIMESLSQTQQQHERSAVEPTERMSRILPLAADQQRFSQLVRRQRSLADRLDALQTSSPGEQAAQRRAAELRQEQQRLQVQLDQLLDQIEEHARQLPADPSLDNLRSTAERFVEDVRASKADPLMTQTQQDLLEKQPQGAAENSSSAASVLEGFLSQCDSMGSQACENCKASFSPSAGAPKPGQSVEQLLRQMGLGKGQSMANAGQRPMPGQGLGMGSDGYSSRQMSPQDLGIYGGLPEEPREPQRGNGVKSDGGFATSRQGGVGTPQRGGVDKTDSPSRRGDTGAVVPTVYQKQVADYFRTLAEELGDQP